MKTTLAILATSVVTAITLYLAKRKSRKDTKILEGTFERIRRTRHGA